MLDIYVFNRKEAQGERPAEGAEAQASSVRTPYSLWLKKKNAVK